MITSLVILAAALMVAVILLCVALSRQKKECDALKKDKHALECKVGDQENILNNVRSDREDWREKFKEEHKVAEELVGEYHKDETEHIAYLEEQCAKSKAIIEQIELEKKKLHDDLKRICEGKLITVEQIKSVYAAAGICDQMHEKTDSDNLMALWATLKEWHKELSGETV